MSDVLAPDVPTPIHDAPLTPALPDESTPPAPEIPEPTSDVRAPMPVPLEPATPGIYFCALDDPGIHPVLGALLPGENDFSEEMNPERLAALASLVQAGVLEQVSR